MLEPQKKKTIIKFPRKILLLSSYNTIDIFQAENLKKYE